MRNKKLCNFILSLSLLIMGHLDKIYASSSSIKQEKTHSKPSASTSDTKKKYQITDNYVHQWIDFPQVSCLHLGTQKQLKIKPKRGQVLVVFFISSWCVPCQRLMDRILELDDKFSKLHTKFIYILTHDSLDDALGFAKEFKIVDRAFLYNDEIIKEFHNPELPSVYVADKEGWLVDRYIKLKYEDTIELEKFLDLINSF